MPIQVHQCFPLLPALPVLPYGGKYSQHPAVYPFAQRNRPAQVAVLDKKLSGVALENPVHQFCYSIFRHGRQLLLNLSQCSLQCPYVYPAVTMAQRDAAILQGDGSVIFQ